MIDFTIRSEFRLFKSISSLFSMFSLGPVSFFDWTISAVTPDNRSFDITVGESERMARELIAAYRGQLKVETAVAWAERHEFDELATHLRLLADDGSVD